MFQTYSCWEGRGFCPHLGLSLKDVGAQGERLAFVAGSPTANGRALWWLGHLLCDPGEARNLSHLKLHIFKKNFFAFFGLCPRTMQVPRLGVKSEL